MIVRPVAPATSVACPTATPSTRKSSVTASPRGFLRGRLFGLTGAASRDASHVADDANEGAAIDARISLGRTLLIAASAALHRVMFVDLGHGILRGVGAWRLEQGPNRREKVGIGDDGLA